MTAKHRRTWEQEHGRPYVESEHRGRTPGLAVAANPKPPIPRATSDAQIRADYHDAGIAPPLGLNPAADWEHLGTLDGLRQGRLDGAGGSRRNVNYWLRQLMVSLTGPDRAAYQRGFRSGYASGYVLGKRDANPLVPGAQSGATSDAQLRADYRRAGITPPRGLNPSNPRNPTRSNTRFDIARFRRAAYAENPDSPAVLAASPTYEAERIAAGTYTGQTATLSNPGHVRIPAVHGLNPRRRRRNPSWGAVDPGWEARQTEAGTYQGQKHLLDGGPTDQAVAINPRRYSPPGYRRNPTFYQGEAVRIAPLDTTGTITDILHKRGGLLSPGQTLIEVKLASGEKALVRPAAVRAL